MVNLPLQIYYLGLPCLVLPSMLCPAPPCPAHRALLCPACSTLVAGQLFTYPSSSRSWGVNWVSQQLIDTGAGGQAITTGAASSSSSLPATFANLMTEGFVARPPPPLPPPSPHPLPPPPYTPPLPPAVPKSAAGLSGRRPGLCGAVLRQLLWAVALVLAFHVGL